VWGLFIIIIIITIIITIITRRIPPITVIIIVTRCTNNSKPAFFGAGTNQKNEIFATLNSVRCDDREPESINIKTPEKNQLCYAC